MRLLNSIHDEIGNLSLPVWFTSICRLKSRYKPTVQRLCTWVAVGKRFAVCSGAKNTKGLHIAGYAPQLPPSFEFTFTLPPKNEKPLTAKKNAAILHHRQIITSVLHYRLKNTALFWFTASPKVVTAEKRETTHGQKITAVLHCHRKNTAIFSFTGSAKVVTAKNEKTATRLKNTAVWQYRPGCVSLKNRHRRPP